MAVPLVDNVVTEALGAGKQFVVVWHPHGAYTTMALMHGARLAVDGEPVGWWAGVAPVLFSVPVLREVLMLANARSVDASTLDKLLAAGHTIGVQPGGIPEQLHTDHRREVAVFPPKLGFIRLAMKHGTDLLPAYIFGENQAYSTFAPNFADAFFKRTGFPLVPVLGRWGLPWLVPRPTGIFARWGRPVPVGPPNAEPTDEQVSEVFGRYVTELKRLFDEHKDACLPAAVAAEGLQVEVRGAHRPRSKL